MNTELINNRERVDELAAWMITGLIALSGFRFVIRFFSWLFFELYQIMLLGGKAYR